MKFRITLLFVVMPAFFLAQNLPSLEIPAPSDQMPSWAHLMYTEEINMAELEEAYRMYYRENAFEKNNYTRYFKRLVMMNRGNILPDGTLRKHTGEEPSSAEIPSDPQPSMMPPGSVWTPFEMHTYWAHNDNASQAMCPWQSNIYSFDIAPTNTNTLYCGTETGGYFKTTDAGLLWTQIAINNAMGSSGGLAVSPANANTVINVAGFSIYRSLDGGSSWTTEHTATDLYGNAVAFKPTDANIVLASTEQGIFRSTNGGDTWTNVLGNTCSDVVFNPVVPTEAYALRKNTVTNFFEFYKSTNSGATWSISSTGWPAGLTEGIGRIGVTAASGTTVYCVLLTNAGPYIVKSTNNGATWTTTAIGGTAALEMDNWQGYYDLDIVVSSANANHLMVGTASAYKSTDGGINFSIVGGYGGSFPVHPDIQEMRSFNGHTWIASDGGLYYSSDFFTSTANAAARIRGINSADFWGFDIGWQEDVMVGGRYHNGNTAWTSDYTDGKFLRMGGAEAPTGYLNPADAHRAYFSDLGGRLLPQTFEQDYANFSVGMWPNESYYTLHSSEMAWHPQCYNTVIIGNGASIYKSTDGALSYQLLFTSPDAGAEIQAIEISRSNPNYIYAVQRSNTLWDGKIWRSTDGGATWTATSNMPGTNGSERRVMQITVSGTGEQEIWVTLHAGGSTRKVFKSVNGGTSWTNITTATIGSETVTDMVHQLGTNGGIYVGCTSGKVYYRNNTMANWVLYNSGLPAALNTLYLKPYYQEGNLRNGSNLGIWKIDFYENSAPLAQPMADKLVSYCVADTFYFADYSVLNLATATWTWSFPGAAFVSNINERNPKVVYNAIGSYDVTLTVTDANGTSTKTIVGMVTIADNLCGVDVVAGSAFDIPAAGNWLAAPAINQSTNTLTLSAWIKPDGNQSSYAGIISSGSDGACGLNFRNSNQLGYHWKDEAGSYNWSGGPTVTVNQWHHVALVISAGSAVVYYDGVPYTRIASHTAALLDEPFLVGVDRGNTSRNFIGEIDEVCIYKRSLSQAEIRELMHLTRENPSGVPAHDPLLLQYYQMNEPFGNIAYNKNGSSHASFVGTGNMSRVVSSAPVGGGVSQRLTITTNGIKNFATPGVVLQFGAGTLPNGEVCASRLDVQPETLPSCANYDNGPHYWILNNYGSNASFTSLTQATFSNIPVFETDNVAAGTYNLQRRAFNATGNTWNPVNNATTANEGATGSFVFGSGITTLGQFFINNSMTSQQITGPLQLCEGEEGVFSLANVTGMTYAWTAIPDGAFSTPGQYTTGASFTENSTISCSLSKNGCNGVAMFNVTIDPSGCTDPDASNYDPSAICDDGTCSTAPDCPGDFTNDGVVNTNDLLFFLGELGCSGTCIADFTNDGLVNTNDLLLFLGWFGTSC